MLPTRCRRNYVQKHKSTYIVRIQCIHSRTPIHRKFALQYFRRRRTLDSKLFHTNFYFPFHSVKLSYHRQPVSACLARACIQIVNIKKIRTIAYSFLPLQSDYSLPPTIILPHSSPNQLLTLPFFSAKPHPSRRWRVFQLSKPQPSATRPLTVRDDPLHCPSLLFTRTLQYYGRAEQGHPRRD